MLDAQKIVSGLKYRADLGLLFDSQVGRYHRVRNRTAKHMMDMLFGGHDPEVIVAEVADRFDADVDRVRSDFILLCSRLAESIGKADATHEHGSSLVELDKRFEQALTFPLRMELELTAVCNWNCGFCYNVWKIDPEMTDSEIRKAVRELPSKHLTIERAKRILDECAARGCYVVRYSGGETLIHPDAFEIFEYGKSLGLYQVVFTNGHFVTPEVAKRLANSNVRCALVSIHGDREQHNQLAGHKLAYDRAIAAMQNLRAVGIEVVAELTLVQENVTAVLDVIQEVYAIGVREFGIMRYVPTGKNDEHYGVPIAVTMPMIHEIDKLTRDKCRGMAVAWPCAQKICSSDADSPLSPSDPSLGLRLSQMVGHCESGIVWGSVSYDGRLRNCPHSNVYFGSVGDSGDEIGRLWPGLTAAVHEAIRPRASCGGCGVADVCRGGCHLGKFFAAPTNSVPLGMPVLRS